MKTIFSIAFLLVVCTASEVVLELDSERTYDYNPNLGIIKEDIIVFCPEPDFIEYLRGWNFAIPNFLFCGARLRMDKAPSVNETNYDNVGANGLEFLACHKSNWTSQYKVMAYSGLKGNWSDWAKCPVGQYIVGSSLRI